MRFAGIDGEQVELQIVGYEYPANTDEGGWDANWLLVRGVASAESRTWSFTNACLTTWEAAYLGEWLAAVEASAGGHKPAPDALDRCWFTEPNLVFEPLAADAGGFRIRVYFELEARPDWARQKAWDEFWIDVEGTSADIRGAADALQAQLKHYPLRGDYP